MLFFYACSRVLWLTCFVFFLAVNFMLARIYGEPGGDEEPGGAGAWIFPEDSWVAVTNLDLQNEWAQYEWSLFKAIWTPRCLMLTLNEFAKRWPKYLRVMAVALATYLT